MVGRARAYAEQSTDIQGAVVAAIERTLEHSERRIPDAILAAAAEQAGCAWIATFDESFVSPSVPSRLI